MSSEYIKKLENILEGVENYRFDDMSCAEWEELTTSVLKGAIAREKANKEADELANSIWNKLANLSESKLLRVVDYSHKMYLELEDCTQVDCTYEDMEKFRAATRNYKTVYFLEGMLLAEL